MRLDRARLLASAAAITLLAGAASAAAISSASAVPAAPVMLAASAATPLPSGAARLGATPAQTKITFDVALNLGNAAGLDALVNGLANKKSPYFHHFLTKGQFGPMFGLSLTQIDQVTSALRALGLDPGPADPSRLYIPVTATATAIDRAFGITMVDYRLPGGRVAYANSAAPRVPASVAPYIEGVLGLDNVYLAQHLDEPSTAAGPLSATAVSGPTAPQLPAGPGPAACKSATRAAAKFTGYTANQFAAHYLLPTLYKMGDLGQGTRVAVAELEPDLKSDISGYEACYHIHTQVKYATAFPGVGVGPGSGEAALDIENIAGLAPDAIIDVYQAANTTTTPLLDIAAAVLDNDFDDTLSISWGVCEFQVAPALLKQYQVEFKALDAQDISVVAAAGDYGPTGCYNPKAKSPSLRLSPESPASSNYVLSVGGTSIKSAAPMSTETAWNGTGTKSPGAGGGGVSELCMPSYQDLHQTDPTGYPPITGLISSLSRKSAGCRSSNDPNGYLRQVPDVSAAASAADSYIVYYNGKWTGFHGTSGSTSLVAAETALIDSSAYCSPQGWNSGPAGLEPDYLYPMISVNNSIVYLYREPQALRDVTSGDTDDTKTGYTGGLYKATKGYDMASGLGVPLLTVPEYGTFGGGLAAFMCQEASSYNISTTSVSPTSATAGRAVTVTVHGTGMIAVPNTDVAKINTADNTENVTQVTADCSSHTTCKVTIPAEKAGTYQIELIAANFLPCHGCQGFATFRFVGAPHVSKISPTSDNQGTRVTIRGSDFIGVSAVYFGDEKGTSLKVISAGELTVVVPDGVGSVSVKVTTADGTSNLVTFRY